MAVFPALYVVRVERCLKMSSSTDGLKTNLGNGAVKANSSSKRNKNRFFLCTKQKIATWLTTELFGRNFVILLKTASSKILTDMLAVIVAAPFVAEYIYIFLLLQCQFQKNGLFELNLKQYKWFSSYFLQKFYNKI